MFHSRLTQTELILSYPTQEPYVELFIWAVLTNKATLIDFFWRRCGSPLLMAIIGAGMYSKLSHFYNDNNKQIKILSDRKLQFIKRANRVRVKESMT